MKFLTFFIFILQANAVFVPHAPPPPVQNPSAPIMQNMIADGFVVCGKNPNETPTGKGCLFTAPACLFCGEQPRERLVSYRDFLIEKMGSGYTYLGVYLYYIKDNEPRAVVYFK